MSAAQTEVTKLGFVKTFVFPALWLFLIPILSGLFFWHAQDRMNNQLRDAVLAKLRNGPGIEQKERAQQIELFEKVPASRLMLNEEFARQMDPEVRFYFRYFRWMILLSIGCIAAGMLVFLSVGICVLASMRSQWMQYICLSLGWQVLRVFGALQTIAQGVMVVSLSYWVTALWFDFYAPKLIVIAAVLAGAAILSIIFAIFRRARSDFSLEGQLLTEKDAPELAANLRSICRRMDTAAPDQIIAGIDDNFFVTEQPVTLNNQKLKGRTLYISLSLLKQMQTGEASAVLAHEMAHFSGNDTTYSRKIAPLLIRYHNYLAALASGPLTKPIYYFMLCFRAMFELSLGKLSRQREFRADRLASEATSSKDLAGALLRIVAYSRYRRQVESELFDQEKVLDSANVSQRLETGFRQFAVAFASDPKLGENATAHPFDSHPALAERLSAVGVKLEPSVAQQLLEQAGDGGWYYHIPNASELEQKQWQAYEDRFRAFHEQSLPFRLLPSNEAEQAIVEKAFPAVAFEGKDGKLEINYLQMMNVEWKAPILFSQITNLQLDDKGTLQIDIQQPTKRTEKLKTKRYDNSQQVIEAVGRYYYRYQAASEYLKQKSLAASPAN